MSTFPFNFISAQKATLSGTVLTQDVRPMMSALVQLIPTDKYGITDIHGKYFIEDIPEGSYILKVSYVGFVTGSATIELQAGENKFIDFSLQEDIFNLGEIVVTGTRNQISRYNAPVIVQSISSRTFNATQSLSISEGLHFTPGLRLENNCQNCGFTQLRMNGLEGAYSQILINSRPVFSALAGVYGLEMLPANMVDRIEVVKGGGSVLYGGNAIAGTINIITKDPVINSFEVGLNQSYIHLESPDRTLTFNGTLVSDDLNRGISFFGFNRQREPWDANGDDFSEITRLKNNTLGFDAFWNTSARSKLKVGAYAIHEFRRGGTAFDLPPHQSALTEQLQHHIYSANISFEQYSKDKKHKYSLYGSAQKVERDSYYGVGGRVLTDRDTLTSTDILALNAYGHAEDISVVGGLQYNYEIHKNILLTAGTEYIFNDVKDEMPGYGRNIDQQVRTSGSYAQLEINPFDRFTLLLGGRYDRVHIKGEYDFAEEQFNDSKTLNVMVPRISALLQLSSNLKARASFAQGYRAPQAFDEDLHIETVGGAARFIRLSPDLINERSNSTAFSLNFDRIIDKRQMNFVLEGFYTRLSHPFILSDQVELPNGISVITKRNGDGATVAGINLEANVALGKRWIFQSGATLQSAMYRQEEEIWSPDGDSEEHLTISTKKLLRTPGSYGYLTLLYQPVKQFSIAYSGVYTGRMDVPHVIDPDTERTIIRTTPRFFEHNIKLSYDLFTEGEQKVQLFGGMQNILNSYQRDFDTGSYRDAGYVYGPLRPRTVFMGVKLGWH
ncbi:MAG TPA: TonB-dependent receptor [Saprospiraceae bacterium]|nr:TonB-dependent receptor [Saprospiraceae bacterium]